MKNKSLNLSVCKKRFLHDYHTPQIYKRALLPSDVQTSLTQDCCKITIPGFPFCSVSWGDIDFTSSNFKGGVKHPFNLQQVVVTDLMGSTTL
jgi:hypothetical protein